MLTVPALYVCLLQVPLPAAAISALAQTTAVFIIAYRAAPSMTVAAGMTDGPVPLQCGGGLRPEHSALLSCRPLPQQVLLGLAMVAWPVGLSWAWERRLRRQHAAMCREWEGRSRQGHGKQQAQARKEEPPPLPPLATLPLTQQPQQQQQNDGSAGQEQSYPGNVAQPPCDTGTDRLTAMPAPRLNLGPSLSLPLWTDMLDVPGILAGQRSISAAAAVGVGPSVRAPRTPYRALTTASVASIKVGRTKGEQHQLFERLVRVHLILLHGISARLLRPQRC